jgi:hypothetical protein
MGGGGEPFSLPPTYSSPQMMAMLMPNQSLIQSAHQERYLSLFWDIYLPSKRQSPQMEARYPFRGWVTWASDIYTQDPALRMSLLAYCLCTIGETYSDDNLWQEGHKLYIRGLRAVGAGLVDPKRTQTDALLMGAASLSFFEASVYVLMYSPRVSPV